MIAFKNPEPWDETKGLDQLDTWDPQRHVYSRYTQATSTRVERVLSKINVSTSLGPLANGKFEVLGVTGWLCSDLCLGTGRRLCST